MTNKVTPEAITEAAKKVTEKEYILIERDLQGTLDNIQRLHNAIETATSTLLPLVTIYLKDLRGIRMAFASEVQDILRSGIELKELNKFSPQIKEFAIHIAMLKESLSGDTLPLLRKLLKDE